MDNAPKKPIGRPRNPGPAPNRVVLYLPPDYYRDLLSAARESDRSVAYRAAELLKRALDDYRRTRAAALASQSAAAAAFDRALIDAEPVPETFTLRDTAEPTDLNAVAQEALEAEELPSGEPKHRAANKGGQ
jgi:hypothetical protein